LQFAAELLCTGGVWTLGTARNFCALSRKVAPGVDVGISCKVEFRGADRIVMHETLPRYQKCQEQAASRESGSMRQRCREQEMSKTKTSKRSRSRRPCQPGGQGPFLSALPCLYRFFPLSKLPSPGLRMCALCHPRCAIVLTLLKYIAVLRCTTMCAGNPVNPIYCEKVHAKRVPMVF